MNELKHYGVLGMKWGVVRRRNPYTKNSPKKNIKIFGDFHNTIGVSRELRRTIYYDGYGNLDDTMKGHYVNTFRNREKAAHNWDKTKRYIEEYNKLGSIKDQWIRSKTARALSEKGDLTISDAIKSAERSVKVYSPVILTLSAIPITVFYMKYLSGGKSK